MRLPPAAAELKDGPVAQGSGAGDRVGAQVVEVGGRHGPCPEAARPSPRARRSSPQAEPEVKVGPGRGSDAGDRVSAHASEVGGRCTSLHGGDTSHE
jgi:hypothetical protein